MKLFSQVFLLAICCLLFLNCNKEHPNKAKSTKILNEINQIAERPRKSGIMEKVMKVSKRVSENREKFPDTREDLINDAKFLKNFFVNSVKENNKIFKKLNELLALNLIETEANCAKYSITTMKAQNEKLKLIIEKFEIFSDKNIKDKSTLEAKFLPVKEKIEAIERRYAEVEYKEKECIRRKKW